MLKTFKTRGIGAGSFFKILYIGNFVWILIVASIAALIAWLMPQSTAAAEAHQYSEIAGHPVSLLIGVVLTPVYALFISFCQWLAIGFGLWLWTRFRCVCITLSVIDECCDKTNDGQCH